MAFGSIVAAATASLALLYRDPPTDEERSRETGAAETEATQSTPLAGEAWTLRRALHSIRLWAAFTMTALGVIGHQIMATHQVAHAVDRGFQYTTVVWLFAFGAGCMMAGNLLGGWLSDHFGRGWVFAFGSIVAIAGIGCLALMSGPGDLPLLLLYTVSGFGSLGGAIGPFLGGWLFDATGSYQLAFAAASFAIAGSAVAAWIAAPGDPRIDVPSPALSRCGRHARIWVRRVVKHAGRPRR